MDVTRQCRARSRHYSGKDCLHGEARTPLRNCSAWAHRGRSLGRAASAWAWPGLLSWRDGSTKHGKEQSARAPGQASIAPPTQPAAVTQGEATSEVADRERHDERAQRSADGSSGDGRDNLRSPASPSAVSHQVLNAMPRLPQLSQPEANTVVTFSYGANMNFLTLVRRDVRVLSRDPAFVVDPAVRLVFKHQGGYATLERADDSAAAHTNEEPRFVPYDGRVHGVLYRVTKEDFDKLSKREGGYVVQEVQVQTYDGQRHPALVFVSNPLFKLPQEVLPTEKYLSSVREGARDNYLDPAYQAFLSGISTVPGAGLGAEYYNTPSKYMGYSFLVVVALITLAFFFQH